MNISVANILLIISITYFILNIDGPFNFMSRIKNYLMLNKYVGVFFYKLFSCAYCTGFWSGCIVFCMHEFTYNVIHLFSYGMIGSIVSVIFISLLNFLLNNGEVIE